MTDKIKAMLESLKAEGKEPHGMLREWAIEIALNEGK